MTSTHLPRRRILALACAAATSLALSPFALADNWPSKPITIIVPFTPGTGMANVGLAPREVRTVILVLGLLAAGILGAQQTIYCLVAPCPQLLGTGGQLLVAALGLIALLATVTVIQRIVHVYQQAKKEPQ